MNNEWGVKIEEHGQTYIEGGMTEKVARHEFDRWKTFGYNTTAVMYRADSDWPWQMVE